MVRHPVAGIIMASGFSNRMGREKLLMEIGGRKIIERVVFEALKSKLSDIVVVCRQEDVLQVAQNLGVRTVLNERADKGQSESVKAGINALKYSGEFEGYMFIQADMPFLKSHVINMLVEAFQKNSDSIIAPLYGGKRKSPVIFPRRFEKDLMDLEGDTGGRKIIKRNMDRLIEIETECTLCGIDIDTMDEYLAAREMDND